MATAAPGFHATRAREKEHGQNTTLRWIASRYLASHFIITEGGEAGGGERRGGSGREGQGRGENEGRRGSLTRVFVWVCIYILGKTFEEFDEE